jgi:transposase
MFGMDAPVGADGQPLVPAELWATFPPAAQAVIAALAPLAQRVVALETEIRALKARLGRNSSNSSRPPSSDSPAAKPKRAPPAGPSGRRPGGQPGHVAHQRPLVPPERVDTFVDHWPARCAGCGGMLDGSRGTVGAGARFVPHQVTELPPVRAHVTEHRRHRVRCGTCGHTTLAALPAAVPAGAFGPRLQATVALLSGRYRLSRREVADLCGTLLDAPLSVGSVDGLCQVTSAALAAAVEEAQASVARADRAHADETGWRQAGHSRWLWGAVTPLVTVFRLATSRSSAAARALLGATFAGVLTSDRWSGYTWVPLDQRQVCWAHLARDWQGLADRGGVARPLGERGVALTRDLFRVWHRFRRGELDRAGLQAATAPVQDGFERLLDDGIACADARAAGLCRALDRLWPALWTFLDEDGVEPTNNAAERALRPAVLWRKGSFGTQSDAGARFVERLLTVVATCKQHGRDALAYLTAACTATLRAQPAPSLLPVPA